MRHSLRWQGSEQDRGGIVKYAFREFCRTWTILSLSRAELFIFHRRSLGVWKVDSEDLNSHGGAERPTRILCLLCTD
jgi:hypothetical protein